GAIAIEDPRLVAGPSERAQVQRMVMSRMRNGGASSQPAEFRSVTCSAVLKVEWPLKSDSPEDLLIFAHALQEKAKSVDLSAKKDADGLSEEEQEVAEESGAVMSEGQGAKAAEPAFIYVRKISDDERTKAVEEAYTKARDEA